METFKSVISENKNTHMTHIEDRVIYGGVKGTREAIFALRDLRDMLGGVKDGNVSVKWDGAPAIFAGIDPSDGEFFVAKKGIFNKNPKVYKSDADVDADTSGDLAVKLKHALKELPKLGIKGVVQGDFLFGPGDVKTQKIKGESYVTFHPNTIVYAVPSKSAGAKAIKQSKIGIVWHTTYKGNSFETMRASYGVDVSKFNTARTVWSQDAMLRDMTKLTMSKKDTEEGEDKSGLIYFKSKFGTDDEEYKKLTDETKFENITLEDLHILQKESVIGAEKGGRRRGGKKRRIKKSRHSNQSKTKKRNQSKRKKRNQSKRKKRKKRKKRNQSKRKKRNQSKR